MLIYSTGYTNLKEEILCGWKKIILDAFFSFESTPPSSMRSEKV